MSSWVGQEEPNGCVCASLAMVLGVTYAEARDLFPFGPTNEGYYVTTQAHKLLKERGWKVAYRTENRPDGGSWPPEPFAPIHMASVRLHPSAPCWHSIVMLGDGAVLDPITPDPKRLVDYPELHVVVGLTPR